MQKLKNFALKRPVLFAALATVVGLYLTEIPFQNLLTPYFGAQPAFYIVISLEQGLTGLLFFGLLSRFGWLDLAGFTPRRQWKALWLGWPLLLFAVINIEEGVMVDFSRPGLIALHLLTALSTGWVEEVLCRGVVVTTLLQAWGRSRRGITLAVLVSSVLFGLVHFANFIMGRMPLINTLTQMTFAVFFGVIFAACVLRNRAIWPMVLLHAAVDWAATLDEIAVGGGLHANVAPLTPNSALISILITLPLFLYGLFILRKVEPAALPLDVS